MQRNDAAGLIAAGNTAVANPAQIWGSPEITDDLKIWLNMGLTLNDSAEFYAFGNFAKKHVDGGFFFRNPNTRSGVFSGDGGDDLVDSAICWMPQDGILDGISQLPGASISMN